MRDCDGPIYYFCDVFDSFVTKKTSMTELLTPDEVSCLERSRVLPRLTTVVRFAKALEVQPVELLKHIG